MEIVEFSFYPDPDKPKWGCLHVLTDAYGGQFDRRATMRGDVDLVRMLRAAYHDGGGVSPDEAPFPVIRGVWQMAPGWPDDWGYDAFEGEKAWSPRFEIGPDGRAKQLET